MPPRNENPTKESSPVEELERILDDAGPEVKTLFATALNTFAGAYAGNLSFLDKKKGLERVIRTK